MDHRLLLQILLFLGHVSRATGDKHCGYSVRCWYIPVSSIEGFLCHAPQSPQPGDALVSSPWARLLPLQPPSKASCQPDLGGLGHLPQSLTPPGSLLRPPVLPTQGQPAQLLRSPCLFAQTASWFPCRHQLQSLCFERRMARRKLFHFCSPSSASSPADSPPSHLLPAIWVSSFSLT